VTLHVAPSGRVAESPRMWPPEGQWQLAARAGALVLPLVTCAVLSTVRDRVPAAPAVLVLVLWVVAAAATGDRIAGLLAAASGGLWFDFFLTAPFRQLAIKGSDDVEATVLLVLIGLAVTEIALWGHRQQARAARRSGYLEGVLGAARLVSDGDTPASALVDVVARQIIDVLGVDDCRFEPGPVPDARVAVLRHDGTVTRGDHTVDVDRVGLPSNDYIAIPVCRGARAVGHFLVTAVSHVSYPSSEQRRVAVLLADQVAGAVETR
jgi:K+-sensing histidine kinase KdpD